jgi:hypothetical protein
MQPLAIKLLPCLQSESARNNFRKKVNQFGSLVGPVPYTTQELEWNKLPLLFAVNRLEQIEPV